MIVRAILKNPDLADNFDFFNDFKDTHNWLGSLPVSHERAIAFASLIDAGLNPDTSTPAIAAMVQATQDKAAQTDEQQQIDQLTETLQSERVAASCGLTIQGHSNPDHLTVFQEAEGGSTHQLLLNITYIGQLEDEDGIYYGHRARLTDEEEDERRQLREASKARFATGEVQKDYDRDGSPLNQTDPGTGENVPSLAHYTRYLLVDNDTLKLAVWTHQDDMENPIVGDSLVDLLNQAAEWVDMRLMDFLESDIFAKHTVIKEKITRVSLSEAEKAVLDCWSFSFKMGLRHTL